MARHAPGAERTVALITFLSKHPDRGFGLSELARRLDLNKATIHSLLFSLVESGWLVRNADDKTYRLGPSLIGVGHAATRDPHVVDLARPHMRRLRDDLDVPVFASTIIDDEIVVVAIDGHAPTTSGLVSPIGHRLPLTPPLGTVFMAWADPDTIDRWLHHVTPDLDEDRRRTMLHGIDTIRRRGYAVSSGDQGQIVREALDTLAVDDSDPSVRVAVERVLHEMSADYLLSDFGTAVESYHLNSISAPVFDRAGHVALGITITSFPRRLNAEQVPAYGQRLLDATTAITSEVGGLAPTSDRARDAG